MMQFKHSIMPGVFWVFFLTDFSYFPFLEVAVHRQIRTKIDLLKGCAEVFSYFSLIFNYFIFVQNHPCLINQTFQIIVKSLMVCKFFTLSFQNFI